MKESQSEIEIENGNLDCKESRSEIEIARNLDSERSREEQTVREQRSRSI